MNIQQLIPKDKSDTETAEKLFGYSYDEIKPIVPELLTWIKDMNWPVAKPVSNYLETISEHLTADILKILRGTDDIWKYWTLRAFCLGNKKPLDEILRDEIKRIIINPTAGEKTEEVDEIAREIIGA
jgi:hypothetical protein